MPTTTVATLIDRAKAASDMRDNFVTPTQWRTWATQERLALDFFLARSGWTLPLADFNITVAGTESGAFTVNPTGGVMAVVCVYQYDTNGRIRMLQHQDAVSFLRRTPDYTGSPSGNAAFYRMQWSGDNLTLNMFPQPSTGETYRVVYLAHPPALYAAVGDYSPSGTLGNITVTHDTASAAGNGYVVTLNNAGGAGTGFTETADSSTVLAYNYQNSATWAGLLTEMNANATYVSGVLWNIDGLILDEGSVQTVTLSGGAYGAHSVAYPMGWEERIVLGMARRALMKEESDTRSVDQEIALWEGRIEEACWSRVLTSSPSIRNVDNQVYGWSDRLSLPPFTAWSWV